MTSFSLLSSKCTFAAPSWVMPGTIEENCLFLAGKVPEIGLLFFETKASLAYGEKDLPNSLAQLPLSWHVHLPSDLPWHAGKETADICIKLMDKLSFLGCERAVLHPPIPERTKTDPGKRFDLSVEQLEIFLRHWKNSGKKTENLFIENLIACPLLPFKELIDYHNCGICLDLGHLLQSPPTKDQALIEWAISRTGIFHAAATKPDGAHGPLTLLNSEEQAVASGLVRSLSPECIIMMELFNWREIEDSHPLMEKWLNI